MVAVVHGGSHAFKAHMSGERHPSTVQYLQNQMMQLRNYIGDSASEWAQRAMQSYERFSSETAMRMAQAALRKVTTHFQEDRVVYLDTLAHIQQAQAKMQRFVMANPMVREKYHAQMCDGYSGSYVDMWPTDIGRGHYDFDRVMNGVIVELPPSKESPEGDFKYWIQTDEEVLEGDVALGIVKQDAILSTWERVEHLMGTGLEDPVSANGGML